MPNSARFARLQGLHVLIIEDEESIRLLLQSDLGSRGMRVTLVKDGAEVEELEAAVLHSIDCVITDVVMPKVSGPAVVENLRKRKPHLPVLFMTGFADAQRLGQVLQQPHTALIDKPFHLEKIALALADLVS